MLLLSAAAVCRLPSAVAVAAGVYIDKTGDTEIDHDVEVVGWGETKEGLKYWEVRAKEEGHLATHSQQPLRHSRSPLSFFLFFSSALRSGSNTVARVSSTQFAGSLPRVPAAWAGRPSGCQVHARPQAHSFSPSPVLHCCLCAHNYH
jgi:hypothetical protein